jgi:hypothetical protein
MEKMPASSSWLLVALLLGCVVMPGEPSTNPAEDKNSEIKSRDDGNKEKVDPHPPLSWILILCKASRFTLWVAIEASMNLETNFLTSIVSMPQHASQCECDFFI